MLVGEHDEAAHYPATVVKHFKKSKEVGVTHLLHFDDGDVEKVGLPDDTGAEGVRGVSPGGDGVDD